MRTFGVQPSEFDRMTINRLNYMYEAAVSIADQERKAVEKATAGR